MRKVDKNVYKPKFMYIVAYIVSNVFLMLVALTHSSMINSLSFFIVILTVGHFLYNNSKLYLLYYTIFSICFLFLDILISLCFNLLVTYRILYFTDYAYILITIIFVTRICEYIYTRLFINFINRREAKNINNKQGVSFLLIPIFSILFIVTLISIMQIYAGVEESILLVINIVLILIMNIYITHIFDVISKNNTLQNEINLYQQQSELQHKYYDNLEAKYQQSRKLIHDIRNHLQSIEKLYEIEDNETAQRYTNDIHLMLNELNQKYYTSNKVLNVILNDKFEIIKNNNINLEFKIGDSDLNFIKEIDITTIFANLLDNAIEAAKTVKNSSFIKFNLDKFNDFTVINISNSISEKPVIKNKKFLSSKVNHEGLGLENIRKTVEKYDGNMVVDYNNNEFKVSIIIPN